MASSSTFGIPHQKEAHMGRALRPCDGNDGQGCRIPHAACVCEVNDGDLFVHVDLIDDDGNEQTLLASGPTVDEAVRRAEIRAGGTYIMNEWRGGASYRRRS